jgi:hypothetical protein
LRRRLRSIYALQTKNVDFTAANSTRPIKTGTVLPATCVAGDTFFKTDAQAGENLYGCPAANTWSVQGGIPSGPEAMLPVPCTTGETYFVTDAPAGGNVYGCTATNVWSAQGNLSIKSGGITVGTRNAANFITGVGLMSTASDDGSEINIQSALDTAVVQTQPGEQSGSALLCASGSGSASQYKCSLNPTLAAYTSGMILHWKPDVAGAGGPTTVNVDTLGTTPLKEADGVSDPAPTDISAGKLYDIWYDGSVFRMTAGAAGTSGGGSVTSVFGRTGPVVALSGDYNTAQVTESGNLYFTNARAWAALSASSPIAFNFSTGAIGCATCLTTGTTAGGDLGGTLPSPAVAKVNGTSVPANSSADQVLETTSSATGAWISVPNCPSGALQYSTSTHTYTCGSSMIYPGAGVPNSTGAAWGTSYVVGASANDLVQLNASGQLPAVSAALLTGFPTLNQSTTGNAATATVLASMPTQCGAGQYSTGVAASGNASCAQVAYSQVSGAPTIPSAAGSNPAMNGTAAPGSSVNYARADHVHPTDTTRQAAITGAPGAWPASFTPSLHASTHQNGGSDEIATATPGASAIPKAGSGGTLAAGWIPSALGSTTSVNGTPIPAASTLVTTGTAVQASQMPALSGDCTSAAGSTVLTCTRSSGALRTYPFSWQGVMQAGISGFAVNLPASNGPAPANSGGAMPIAALEWPTAQSAYYAWWTWVMPAGYTGNGAISYSIESRCNAATCDSTRANIMTLGLGCSGGGSLDAPAIVNAGPVNITNGASAAQTITAGTLTPNSGGLPACAAGNRVWVRMIVDTNTNSLTGPFDLASATFSVQGGM